MIARTRSQTVNPNSQNQLPSGSALRFDSRTSRSFSLSSKVTSHVNWMYPFSVGSHVHGIVFQCGTPVPSFGGKLNGISACILSDLLQGGPNRFLDRFGVLVSRRDAPDNHLVMKPNSISAGRFKLKLEAYIIIGNGAEGRRLGITEPLLPSENRSAFGSWVKVIEQPSTNISCVVTILAIIGFIQSSFPDCHDSIFQIGSYVNVTHVCRVRGIDENCEVKKEFMSTEV
jgi:hypothetical protein